MRFGVAGAALLAVAVVAASYLIQPAGLVTRAHLFVTPRRVPSDEQMTGKGASCPDCVRVVPAAVGGGEFYVPLDALTGSDNIEIDGGRVVNLDEGGDKSESGSSHEYRFADSKNSQLYLISGNAPQTASPHLGELPPGIDRIIGVSADHTIYAAALGVPNFDWRWNLEDDIDGQLQPIRIVSRGILENSSPQMFRNESPPHTGKIKQIILSPDGRRLMWVIRYSARRFGWFSHLVQTVAQTDVMKDTRRAVSVWTTDVNGKHPEFVGEEPYIEPRTGDDGKNINPGPNPAGKFRWSSSGKSIQFVYGDIENDENGGREYELPLNP